MNELFHTPEGVRDIYNAEFARKLQAEGRIREVLRRYGCSELTTPSFEFFDMFSQERGSVASRELYKFFDREGNTLVLRPDMTPPVARCAAKYYTDETVPIRLSYLANTFINPVSYQGRLRESTVQGAEFIGDGTVNADAELLALTIECLLAAGLTDFQVDVGQVDFFGGLVEEAGLSPETEQQLRSLIEEKNFFGVEELMEGQSLAPELLETFLKLPELFGPHEVLEAAGSMTGNRRALAAVRRLEDLYRILGYYGLSDYVSFDLGMLGKYRYYTGIIFRGVTFGMGEPIVSGGRYDSLMRQFGKDAPAVGFSISIDGLMSALSRQKLELPVPETDHLLLYEKQEEEQAVSLAASLRKAGRTLILLEREKTPEEYLAYAGRSQIREVLLYKEDGIYSVGPDGSLTVWEVSV